MTGLLCSATDVRHTILGGLGCFDRFYGIQPMKYHKYKILQGGPQRISTHTVSLPIRSGQNEVYTAPKCEIWTRLVRTRGVW